jgi:hypothetical protein
MRNPDLQDLYRRKKIGAVGESGEAEVDTNKYRRDVPSEQQNIRVTAFGLLSG